MHVSFQCKFKPFYKYAKSFNSDDFDYDALESSNYIFMRWKVSFPFVLKNKALFSISRCLGCEPASLSLSCCPQEQFLVPDHTIKDISGASFAGFYYICFQKSTATIEGYYYHRSSEW